MSDIELAFETIKNKRSGLDTLWSYANGGQPLKYSTERLEEAFGDIRTHFELNWCSVIVDATLDRLNLTGFDTRKPAVDLKLKTLFANLHLDIDAYQVHNAALATTEAFVIAWKTDNEIELYYNDPRLCTVIYESARPKVKRFAAKWFVRDDGSNEITLYYTDRLEHWASEKKESEKADSFELMDTEKNPFGVIPVFEFASPGEFVKVITMQDAVNKLFADMMVAAEFGAFVQRWVISESDPGQLKNGPNMIWWIPSGDGQSQSASVGQFSPTDLQTYLRAMDQIANSMAIISRTPKHYFMDLGSNISGEALMSMEAPLTKKVKSRQRTFGAQWQEVASFLLLMEGENIKPADITVLWERPETIQVYTEAQARQLAVNSGIPLITVLRKEGWTDVEIEKMQTDQELQDKARKTVAQAVLNDLRIKQEQQNAFNVQEQNNAAAGGTNA
jgi:hypothetical protein